MMKGEKSEEDFAREIREMMKRKNIKKTDDYLRYLQEQKELKRDAAKKRVEEAEWEINVIRKMRKGVL